MRILYSTPAYKPADRMGGPIASVSAAAEMLVARGHEVTVVTTNANLDRDIDVPLDRPVDVDGVTVWYFRRRELLKEWLPFVPYLSRSMGYAYAPSMKAALKELVSWADVVDTQMPFVYPTYAAARAALRAGKPFFYHQRGNFLPARLGRGRLKKDLFLRMFEKPMMRRAAALIALTEGEREAFQALAPETPCSVIPNGVTVPELDQGAAPRIASRYGIPEDAVVILYFGRLEVWKGVEELLQTFAAIQAANRNAHLVMAGVDERGATRRWQPIAEREGFAGRLHFTGSLSGIEKSDVLHRANLFALPSSGEGLSMATLEALAHRTAVMLSPECHFPEAERAGAGITVAKDVEAMVPALEGLIRDRERLRTMGEAGQRLVLRDYSWSTVADRLLELYSRRITTAVA